jgi:hypothetical protein
MKIKELKKEIKGVFKPPKKKYYLGKIKYGTPYFNPRNFHPTIVSFRKLKFKSEEEKTKYAERFPHLKDKDVNKFSNLPMVRRNKEWIKNIFGSYYLIQIGYPIAIKNIQLGWKWKYDDVRYEWYPSFQIYFFLWQFVISWHSPDGNDNRYYEQILHYLKKANKDIKVAEETWKWVDCETKKSTWNKNYLL